MRINTFSKNHEGCQPIRVLQHNIISQFEKATPTFLELTKTVIKEKGLQAGIGYQISTKGIKEKVNGHHQTPYVNEFGKIVIHETFLSYVWCVCYSMLVLSEEAIAKPSMNKILGTNHLIDKDKIEKATELFDYAKSLIVMYDEWDKDLLPNPEDYSKEDDFYIVRANGLFVSATNFILCHEFAHVEFEHTSKKKEGKNSKEDILKFEKEADARAMELILLGVTSGTRLTIELGTLIGLSSLLFFDSESKESTHPATDDRIHKLIEKINPPTSAPHWSIACLAFQLWDNQFNKSLPLPKKVNDYKELYEHMRSEIKKENNE